MVNLFRVTILCCLCMIATQVNAHGEDISSADPAFNIMEKINEARSLLEKSNGLGYDEHRVTARRKNGARQSDRTPPVISRRVLYRQQIALAILDKKTGCIIEKRYWLDTEEIIRANRMRNTREDNTGPAKMPRFHPYIASRNFEVVVNWWNTFNSDLSVKNKGQDNAEQYVVLANKYLIPNRGGSAHGSHRNGSRYLDIVYVPYSRALHSEAMIDAGKAFLNNQVAQAFTDLREKQVKSRGYSGRLATDTMSENFIKCLLINEHSDPGWMLSTKDKGRWVAERFLILLAANGERAFRFSDSRTGALGIAQIMPETYAHVVNIYPGADLIGDVDRGRAEMANAIKASILVCDDLQSAVVRNMRDDSSSFQQNYRRLFDAKSEEEVDEIRAAMYNGGPKKYILATGSINPRVQETVSYVKKFNFIRSLNMFE
ncbi:MAG: hypothetical protein COX19_01055 [Desulfobacterales bacterium CG23_combo_of_CG06-09_8_20_14_all_51_8]|nr:MAG: hypothetical protein COX19_01055 [Desulfobacterales bacterium CG23_combo_of_CG06-09_8_20_14_all_51_8]